MQRRLVLKKICLLAVAVAVTLLFAEITVRVFFPQGLVVPWQDEVSGITAPRANVHGRHLVPHTFDVALSFTSQRFRGTKEFAPVPSPQSLRIAALGDSFTLGIGAGDDECYPADLERSLQSANVEVINAANAGTGTGDQALWYELWVKTFHPKIVVLGVTSNDVDDDAARGLFSLDANGRAVPGPGKKTLISTPRRVLNAVPGYDYLAQHSQLWGLIRNVVSARLSPANTTRTSRESFVTQGVPMMSAEIRWLEDQVRRENARLVVVFIPSRESIYESSDAWADDVRWKSDVIVNALTECCAKDEITFLDLRTRLQAEKDSALYYNGLDTHPTPAGYRAISSIVAKLLIEKGLVTA